MPRSRRDTVRLEEMLSNTSWQYIDKEDETIIRYLHFLRFDDRKVVAFMHYRLPPLGSDWRVVRRPRKSLKYLHGTWRMGAGVDTVVVYFNTKRRSRLLDTHVFHMSRYGGAGPCTDVTVLNLKRLNGYPCRRYSAYLLSCIYDENDAADIARVMAAGRWALPSTESAM